MLKLGIVLLVAIVQLSTQCNINNYGLYQPATYEVAVRTCALDGSQLIVPIDQEEMRFVTVDLNWGFNHWLGIHNLLEKEEFITLNNGEPFEENDILKWKVGSPDNTDGSRSCVRTDEGGLVDDICGSSNRFICKKASFGRSPVTESNTASFNQAVVNCALKGAQLMFPQNAEELSNMAFLSSVFTITPWIGIYNSNDERSFIDLNGESVFPNEFLVWEEGSPSEDSCVKLLPNSLIRSVPCDIVQNYLCNK